MKVLTNDNNLVKYLLEDSDTLTDGPNYLLIEGSKPKKVLDMKNGNYNIYFDVTLPEDFRVGRYFYDGETWTENENWVDPTIDDIDYDY